MNEKITIFDTTLRDGEQSPGFSMTKNQKIDMALQLGQLGVDVMEAGFPIASEGDYESVSQIAQNVKESVVTGLARANQKDIEAVASATKSAERRRIHTFISTSDLHIQFKLKSSRQDIMGQIYQSVAMARQYTDDVQWSAEDASRTDIDYLCQCVETAIKAGAKTINLPDTVGYAEPDDYADMFLSVMNRVPNSDTVVFSAHCHDDRGMAIANSLSAIKAGVRQVECTINGIGERAGNAALEEIVMAMKSRPDKYPFSNNINTHQIMATSDCLQDITGINVQPNKAITGRNAFAHASGIHQHGMLANRGTYEVIKPEDVGAISELMIGKHSGLHAIKNHLKVLGFEGIQQNSLKAIYNDIIHFCDEHKTIHNSQIKKFAKTHTL